MLLSGAAAAYASRSPTVGRSLLQGGTAYSCDAATGCTLCPEGCDTCSRASTSGNFRCTQCKADTNRVPALDGSCGCRAGSYIDTTSKKCVVCDQDNYCLGGTEAASVKTACPNSLGTKRTGAIRLADCANKPGYSYNAGSSTADPSQAICPQNTFNTGYNRLGKCSSCPGGLKTLEGLILADWPAITDTSVPDGFKKDFTDITGGTGKTTAADCLVPPGYYTTSSNKAVRCPKGEYRAGYTAVGATTSNCMKCPRGTTTYRSGSPSISYCDQLLPGHYWIGSDIASTTVLPEKYPGGATPTFSNVPAGVVTMLCPRGSYCPGWYPTSTTESGRISCTNNLWTRAAGSRTINDCRVPPGHKYVTGNGVTQCDTTKGEYSNDWRFPGLSGATTATNGVGTCDSCGSPTPSSLIIQSDNIEPLATFSVSGFTVTQATIYVPRSTRSCYIEQGEGMVLEKGIYRKVLCNGRNYGVAAKSYGVRQQPCTDCPLGMVTDSLYKNSINGGFFDPRACKTPAGFGFDGVQAVRCASGTWNDGGADPADRCKPCPEGTTTAPSSSTASDYDAATKCLYTVAGYAKQDSSWSAGKALTVCPKGTFSEGGAIISNSACTYCDKDRTTPGEGSTSASACDACPLGKGEANSADPTKCSNCKEGYFGDDNRAPNDFACKLCPGSSTFNFIYPSSNNPITVTPTTELGATSSNQCLLSFASILDANWYYKGVEATSTPASSDADCRDKCAIEPLCQFFTWDYNGSKCYLTAPTAATDGKIKVAYKVLAGTNTGDDRRRSLLAGNGTSGPKAMGSGVWSWWSDAAAGGYGTQLSLTNFPTQTIDNCLKACNDEELCAAVVFTAEADITASTATVTCNYRQGVTTLPTDGSADTSKRTMLRYRTGTAAAGVKPTGA
ncbi:hypothetical protein OEZ85_000428 [Tetradesmus obliquus]|uniref:Apple domain-containing protein n=1 Tax=Tetradesmus obliquus TaxID=3088 RepID=A0ABY8URL8_TETOB|nr:hypothetical protein OEZ85_000428 [Tetradesmus obliquus]